MPERWPATAGGSSRSSREMPLHSRRRGAWRSRAGYRISRIRPCRPMWLLLRYRPLVATAWLSIGAAMADRCGPVSEMAVFCHKRRSTAGGCTPRSRLCLNSERVYRSSGHSPCRHLQRCRSRTGFGDFAVKSIFRGTPAEPQFTSPRRRATVRASLR